MDQLSPLSASTVTEIDDDAFRAARVFKLLADESRLRILFALSRFPELHVQRICDMLGQTQPAVSHHLALMRHAGMVTVRRDGKHNYYRLETTALRKPIQIIETLMLDEPNRHEMLEQ